MTKGSNVETPQKCRKVGNLKRERTNQVKVKGITPKAKISGRQMRKEQGQRAPGTDEKGGREALTVLDQSMARKARYQGMENKQGNNSTGRKRRPGGC